MAKIYPDMSITEIKIMLHFIDDMVTDLSYKSVNDPMDNKDYKKLYRVIEGIQKVNRCKWIKEYY